MIAMKVLFGPFKTIEETLSNFFVHLWRAMSVQYESAELARTVLTCLIQRVDSSDCAHYFLKNRYCWFKESIRLISYFLFLSILFQDDFLRSILVGGGNLAQYVYSFDRISFACVHLFCLLRPKFPGWAAWAGHLPTMMWLDSTSFITWPSSPQRQNDCPVVPSQQTSCSMQRYTPFPIGISESIQAILNPVSDKNLDCAPEITSSSATLPNETADVQ